MNDEDYRAYMLLDYVIKLQQELKIMVKDDERSQETIIRLTKENERLKEQLESVINENQRLLKQWFENNNKTVKLVSEKEYYNQNFKDYKSRCEKAIEYINNHIRIDDEYPDYMEMLIEERDELLNILQNGDNSSIY